MKVDPGHLKVNWGVLGSLLSFVLSGRGLRGGLFPMFRPLGQIGRILKLCE